MTKLAEIMNKHYATEGFSVEELIADAVNALDDDELVREFIELIYHLDEVIK